jgi:hypothetical protein
VSDNNAPSLSQTVYTSPDTLKHPAWLSPKESPQSIHAAVTKLIGFMTGSQDKEQCDDADGKVNT